MTFLLILTCLSLAGLGWILLKMFWNLMDLHDISPKHAYHKYVKRPICRVRIKTLRIQRHISGESDPHMTLKNRVRDKIDAFSRYSQTNNVEDSVMGSENFRTEFLKAKLLELRTNVLDYLPEGNGRIKPADVFMLEILRRELRMLGWSPAPVDTSKLWLKKENE